MRIKLRRSFTHRQLYLTGGGIRINLHDFTGVLFLCRFSSTRETLQTVRRTKVDVIEKEDELHEKLTAE